MLCVVPTHSGGQMEFMNFTPAIQDNANVIPCRSSSGKIHLRSAIARHG
jgi:hypothetical protein